MHAGAALLGGVGYLYIGQRAMLMKVLQVPILVASLVTRKAWAIFLKPILRKLISLKGGGAAAGAAAAGGELPGGSY